MTHKQKVLQLLSDNQPHSHLEGYRLGVMMHSRVDDLRHDDGYTIKCWYENKQYWYQLFGTVREGEDAADGLAALSALPLGPSIDNGPPEPPPLDPQTPGMVALGCAGPDVSPDPGPVQLSVWEAA